ncbi:MAG TPA: hypothetical protein VL175_02510 [Pirellulales bacterium]|jgi:hypothetical protein|nr:hypothetical protein [Pirellulales bacterium]
MRTLSFALIALTLAALGCAANTNQVLLEQESRMLEDRVWHLQAMLEDCQAAREAASRENEQLKKQLEAGGGDARPRGATETLPPPKRGRTAPPVLQAPTIELPDSSSPPDLSPPEVQLPSPGEEASSDSAPTQLLINKRFTSGLDRDGQDGDEGVVVLVELRDAAGRLVKNPGAISVVVMDPTLKGDAARVARWDFPAGDVPALYKSSPNGRGFEFELPWPAGVPTNRALRLFVRCTTAGGKKITSESPLNVRLAGDPPRTSQGIASQGEQPKTQSASRPPARKPPSSRLKSRSASRGNLSDADTDEDDVEEDDVAPRGSPRGGRVADRPTWRPYR